MERIVKLFCLILFVFCMSFPCFAETPTQQPAPAPQKVALSQCIKTFNIGYEKLFFLSDAAISSYNYEINEIQSHGGYIVFTAGGYKFLASVLSFADNKAILKITPCNNDYAFPFFIINNIYKYIEANQYKKF